MDDKTENKETEGETERETDGAPPNFNDPLFKEQWYLVSRNLE